MQTLPSNIVTRIAPTPSGYLHIGNVLSFAITWALAKQHNGHIILRIDDIDNSRYRPEYVEDIFATLVYLGIDYDWGPRSLAEFESQYSQMLKLDHYNHILNLLKENGKLYACDCSRSQINTLSPKGLYLRKCAHGHTSFFQPNTAWRVKVPEHCPIGIHDALLGLQTIDLGQTMPDFVVRKKDGVAAYQIASLADDLNMGVNLIVRGLDLIDSTAAQLFLAKELGYAEFTQTAFVHHPLIMNADGEKLSKSRGDTSIHYMRHQGISPGYIWAQLAQKAGIDSHKVQCARDFADAFDAKALKKVAQPQP